MQVKTTYTPNIRTTSSQITNTKEIIPDKISESSLSSLSASPALKSKVFFEDIIGFIMNVALLPFHGPKIIFQQTLLILFLPLLLPLFVLYAVFEIMFFMINLLSCGALYQSLTIPSFYINEPSDKDIAALRPFIRHTATEAISADNQIKLLNTINTYFKFSMDYMLDHNGISNSKFSSLIKVEVDGHCQLFEYKPFTSTDVIFENYLNFLEKHARPDSKIKHTFVSLDYSHFLGLLKMKIKTDIVKVKLGLTKEYENPTLTQTFISYIPDSLRPTSLQSMLPKFFLKPSACIKQSRNADNYLDNFSLWPAYTRQACCRWINQSLRGNHLNEYQISLLDFDNIIRLID